MTIEQIINQYPKTDDCEFQTLGELRDWQINEIYKLVYEFADYYKNSIANRDLRDIEQHFYDFNVINQKAE